MTGFAQESAMPEHLQGHNETAASTAPEANAAPSVQSTDRFGLAAAGKSYLLRRYNIQVSAAGNPYFTPIQSVLNGILSDVESVLNLARQRHAGDDERKERASKLAIAAYTYFEECLEAAGEGREWLARKRVIWPLNDELGFQLYKAAAGLDDLADFGAYLVNSDANITSIADARDDERYQKRQFWSELALDEAGELDAMIQAIEETNYNLTAMVSQGYRNQANMDTKIHLQGVRENAPATGNNADIKAQMKSELMAGNPF